MSEVVVMAFDSAIHIVSLATGQALSVPKSSDSTLPQHHALDVSERVVPHCDKAAAASVSARLVLRTCHVSKALIHALSPVQVPQLFALLFSFENSVPAFPPSVLTC